jgi:hypothetical protein
VPLLHLDADHLQVIAQAAAGLHGGVGQQRALAQIDRGPLSHDPAPVSGRHRGQRGILSN